ncbi:MAG: heme exporter protein CcmB [Cyclobacteriaceae bacterium]
MLKEISILLKKEMVTEWRLKYALNGILLYLVGTVFICYLSFNLKTGALNATTWNALFWIIILFTAVSAVAKSFLLEPVGRLLYYYQIASPQAIIISKIIYHGLLMFFLAGLGLLFYILLMGNPIQDLSLFLVNTALGSLGLSITLTMVSGIAAKADNSHTLMAILSFPILIPILLLVINISKNALDGLGWEASGRELLTLLALNTIVASVAFILFPYLWRS